MRAKKSDTDRQKKGNKQTDIIKKEILRESDRIEKKMKDISTLRQHQKI